MRKVLFASAVVLGVLLCLSEMAMVDRLPSYMKFGFDRDVDSFGNIFIVSGTCYSKSDCRYVIAKYEGGGKQLWSLEGASMGYIHDFFADVGVDAQGSVYIVQRVPVCAAARKNRVVVTRFGCVTAKYDPNGRQVWATPFNASNEEATDPTGIAVSKNGDVYITGTCAHVTNDFHIVHDVNDIFEDDILTRKYNRDGHLLWSVCYNGQAGNDNWPKKILVDAKGSVYVAGTTSERSQGGSQFLTLKYDASGTLLWACCYTPRRGVFSGAESLVVDDAGNVYVLGSSMTLDDRQMELVTVKYDMNGEQQWVARYSDHDKKSANPAAVALDAEGRVHIVGYISHSLWQAYDQDTLSNATGEFVTIKYNTAGKEEWAAKYEKPLSAEGWISGIRIDDRGNTYLIGQIGSEVFIVKYDSEGKQQWTKQCGILSEFLKVLSTLYDSGMQR
jgi:hypothetical protein